MLMEKFRLKGHQIFKIASPVRSVSRIFLPKLLLLVLRLSRHGIMAELNTHTLVFSQHYQTGKPSIYPLVVNQEKQMWNFFNFFLVKYASD